MTRTVRDARIESRAARKVLARAGKPYYRAIEEGLHLGYRKGKASGKWVLRRYVGDRAYMVETIGLADDTLDADGDVVLSFAQAQGIARQRFTEAKQAATAGTQGVPATVGAALGAYAEAKRQAGQHERAGEAETVLRRHVPPTLASAAISDLTADTLRDWLVGLGRKPNGDADPKGRAKPTRPMSQGRVDKIRGVLKAALRGSGAPIEAVRDGLGASAVPNRVEPVARNVILSRDEVGRLLRELDAIDPALGLFARACDITGARPGQLARCALRDVDIAGGILTIPRSAKGKPGTRKTRRGVPFPVGPDFARRIVDQADGGSGLIFHAAKREQDLAARSGTSPSGTFARSWKTVGRTAWHKGLWVRDVRAAVKKAGLSGETTLYSLRHTRAVALIRGGLSLREVAALLDTSAAMLERTYSRDIAHGAATTARVRELLAAESARHDD